MSIIVQVKTLSYCRTRPQDGHEAQFILNIKKCSQLKTYPKVCFLSSWFPVREGFKTPSHGKCPLGGYPPPPPGGLRTRFFCKVSEKNLTDKGGTPPRLRTQNPNFFRHKRHFLVFFTQKTLFLAQKVNEKKVNGKGGYPLPPLNGRSVPKNRTEKS